MIQSVIHPKTTKHANLNQVFQQIGNTPLFEIKNAYYKPGVKIYAKLEWQQLGSSVKARPAFQIIKNAILLGHLQNGKRLLDATSGNTGIAYASIGAALGVPVTLALPENASEERKTILNALGAEIIFTSKMESTDGAQKVAKEMATLYPDKFYYADQYNNDANWQAHFSGTAPEIWQQTRGTITHFVAGLGTTGTFTGTGRGLKKLDPNIQLVALQPDNPMHGLEGWKHLETAKVPGIYNQNLADQFKEVDTYQAYEMVKNIARKEGLLVSPSAAANLLGAIQIAEEIESGVIVTTFADTADKYSEVLEFIFAQ